MRRPFVLAAMASLIAVGRPAPPARAQSPADLPKAETVLDQYVEATGGKAAYEKLKNRTASGTIEIVGAGVKGTLKLTQAAPNRMVVVTDLGAAAGQTTQGTDGKSVWMLSPLVGDRIVEGEEKEEFLRQATFHDDLRWKELYDKAECTGIEQVDGKPAYKIVMTPKSGKPTTKYYDKASHLMIKEEKTSKSPMGEITVEVYPSDYKKVDGVLIPFTATQKLLGQAIELKMQEIKHNVDLPADAFKRPASLDEAEKKKAA
jgi:zinc protease